MESSARTRSFLRTPAVLLFGSQLLAAAAVFLIVVPVFTSISNDKPAVWLLLALQGIIAAVPVLFFGLTRWWAAGQLALPFAAYYSLYLQAPAWLWLVFFVVVLLVYKNSVRSGVPLYLSNRTTWSALAELLPQTENLKIIDLGGGLGGTSLYLARHRPDIDILSVESAPIPALLSKIRNALAGLQNVDMRYGDYWDEDLSAYQVVYAFLSPVPMPRLYEKVRAEMKAGGLFISNSFDVPGVEADEVIELADGRKTRLYLWRT